jgi:rhodanese-related sulfurtransferase
VLVSIAKCRTIGVLRSSPHLEDSMPIKVSFVLALSLLAFGCNASKRQTAPAIEAEHAAIKTVTISEVASFVQAHSAVIVDANGEKTRREQGVIPSAVLLTDHENYSLSELPPAKLTKLVFYCGNLQCGASHVGAARAVAAGYSDVNVLPDGIAGWKQSGQPTAEPKS